METDLYQQTERALLDREPAKKCLLAKNLFDDWRKARLGRDQQSPVLAIDDPGRPERPCLVDPRNLKRRSTATEQGRIYLLHAFAHIEFCAINIALDAVYRFRDMPDQFVHDWLQVASEEARHFQLIDDCLRQRGSYYGDCEAHSGLWDMVCKTRHDVLHRMALVPRVMEARGLDVTPGMIKRFQQADDVQAAEILEIIYADEIGHVAIGNFWYRDLCKQRSLEPTTTFQSLVDDYLGGKLRGPFNWQARLEAGFEKDELQSLEQRQAGTR